MLSDKLKPSKGIWKALSLLFLPFLVSCSSDDNENEKNSASEIIQDILENDVVHVGETHIYKDSLTLKRSSMENFVYKFLPFLQSRSNANLCYDVLRLEGLPYENMFSPDYNNRSKDAEPYISQEELNIFDQSGVISYRTPTIFNDILKPHDLCITDPFGVQLLCRTGAQLGLTIRGILPPLDYILSIFGEGTPNSTENELEQLFDYQVMMQVYYLHVLKKEMNQDHRIIIYGGAVYNDYYNYFDDIGDNQPLKSLGSLLKATSDNYGKKYISIDIVNLSTAEKDDFYFTAHYSPMIESLENKGIDFENLKVPVFYKLGENNDNENTKDEYRVADYVIFFP